MQADPEQHGNKIFLSQEKAIPVRRKKNNQKINFTVIVFIVKVLRFSGILNY